MNNQDITNYAYIWYNKDPTNLFLITEKDKITIYNIINLFSYPNYLSNYSIKYHMSESDKNNLLNNELLFIKKKFLDNKLEHIIILQIPRILYDLFNLYFYYENKLSLKFGYTCNDTSIQNILSYNEYTRSIMETMKNKIFELNSFIIKNIVPFLIDNITTKYDEILEVVIKNINSLNNIITAEKRQVLQDVLCFEKEPTSGYTILYRGANYEKDSTIRHVGIEYCYLNSISLNISILSGFIGDPDACTLNYITRSRYNYKEYNNKIKYTIKKFHLDDSSNEFNLFFIPPINPFLQLYCAGELWHPRTKIGKNFFECKHIQLTVLVCDLYKFVQGCDYLVSNKTYQELEELYQIYKSNNQINFWLKYLKYKKKYL